MLPSALFSTYQKYKQDTDSIAAWLASTAKSVGFSADLSAPVVPPSTTQVAAPNGGGRLKRKARKQAKQQAALLAAEIASQAAGSKYIINVKNFVPLAEYIAGKSVKVPATFGKTIDRVIAARSEFGAKLKDHGEEIHGDSVVSQPYILH
jgi:hypothetical protein